jgi:hypothetical protein
MSALSAADVTAFFTALSATAVTIGVVFGLIQLRQAVRASRNRAAADVVRTVQTQQVRFAVRRVLDLPIDADPEFVRANPEMLEAALAVDSACEMWGSMVFEGVVEHRMLDRMVGGWVRATWERLRRWIESERALTGNPNIAEWWQWLYELLKRDPDPGKAAGAHVSYCGRRRIGDF